MSTPDPKTVREIAAKVANIALHDSVHVDQWISAVIDSDFGNECSQVRAPLHAAVVRRMATVRPSWPAEQQPADVVTAEQQQDGAVGGKGSVRAASLLAFLDLHRERRGHDVIASLAVGDGRTVELTQVQLRAVLAERTALAARVAELEGEREADVRAVAEACSDFGNDEGPRGIRQLYARFADRIAALDATETEES